MNYEYLNKYNYRHFAFAEPFGFVAKNNSDKPQEVNCLGILNNSSEIDISPVIKDVLFDDGKLAQLKQCIASKGRIIIRIIRLFSTNYQQFDMPIRFGEVYPNGFENIYYTIVPSSFFDPYLAHSGQTQIVKEIMITAWTNISFLLEPNTTFQFMFYPQVEQDDWYGYNKVFEYIKENDKGYSETKKKEFLFLMSI